MESKAQAILDKRMGEVAKRIQDQKEAIQALFAAYPDIREWAKDMHEHVGPVKTGDLEWAIHGPLRGAGRSVEATIVGNAVQKKGRRK